MKEIIADIRQSLGDRSIDRVQQNLASFMREYRRGQQCLGVLISATSVHLTSVQGYDRWLKSDEQCVREFHDLASRPLLRASKEIKSLCTVILEASEQDFGNLDLEKALDGQFEAPLSPATRGR